MLADGDTLDVVIGVDTHKHTHTAAALSGAGGILEYLTVGTDPRGYRRLWLFGQRFGAGRVWAIEGTGTYGAGLTAALLARGERVVEVDRPHRPARRAGAKSDEIDAVRAAREVLSGECSAQPRHRGTREAIRVLLVTRGQAMEVRTRALCALQALVVSAPSQLRQRLRPLSRGQLVETCATLRRSARHSDEEFATVMAMRATARRVLACEREAAELEFQLEALVRQMAPSILDHVGIGPVVAAQVIASWSHPGRVRSEAAFAHLAGVAPVPASSGQTLRHRLNHAGDRQLNRALHTIALVRTRQDDATKAYVARRLAEGRTPREIRRCLKRYIARQLYRELEALPALDRT